MHDVQYWANALRLFCSPVFDRDVIDQKRVRVFHQGFQTPRKRREHDDAFIVSRCLEPLMKNEARVFELASQMQQ